MHIRTHSALLLSLALLGGLALVRPTHGQELSPEAQQLQQVREQQATYDRQRGELQDQEDFSEEGLKAAEAKLIKERQVVAESTRQLEELSKRMNRLKTQRGAAMEASYVTSGDSNMFYALVDSATLSEFLSKGQYTNFIVDKKLNAVDTLDELVKDFDRQRRDLITRKNAVEEESRYLEKRIAQIKQALSQNKSGSDAARALEAYLTSLTGDFSQIDRKELKNNEPVGGRFAFIGGGTEHGLGMSQYGAKGAAARGRSYQDIIAHYYQQTRVEVRNPECNHNGENMEDYLVGVVEAEMPTSWPSEALKAQAVAARSYAALNCGRLDNSPRTQAWVGKGLQTDAARRAVAETRGQVVTYGGQIVQAFFHSTSGGHTENNENVWGGSPLAWLRGVASPWESDSPHWTWRTKSYSREQMQAIVSGDARTSVGELQTIKIVGRGVGGRVTSVQVIGSAGAKTVSGPRFKTIFNTYSPADERGLKSTLFGFN